MQNFNGTLKNFSGLKCMDEILSCLKDLTFCGSNYFSLKESGVGDGGSAEAAWQEFKSSKPSKLPRSGWASEVSIRMDCRSLEGAGAPAEPTSWGS